MSDAFLRTPAWNGTTDSMNRSYVITHAHLDHINGLVLCAGSFSGPPRRIFGSPDTLKGVETVFSDRLWPNLASWDPADTSAALLYAP